MDENYKILLVEDDPFISEIYSRKLENAGFNVRVAQDGLEALDQFQDFKPKMVLLDIMLPKKNGWEILAQIKTDKTAEVKVIMLTNLGEQSDIDKSFELGADDYIVKSSLTPAELIEIIRSKM